MIRERLVDEFCHLVSIDAPSYGERKMADYIKDRLSLLGVQMEEDDSGRVMNGSSGNLYGFWKGTMPGEPILFSMHMDTVAPAVGKKAVVHDDGRITSDGTTVLGADDMSAVAALLEAMQCITEEGISHRDIELLITAGEEMHLQGSRNFDFSRIKANESYVLDLGGKVGCGAHRAPSLAVFEAEVLGKSAHAGFAPEEGVHAVKIASRAVGRLQMGKLPGQMTVNIGRIEGGGATNIVPDRCKVSGEVRGIRHESVLEQLNKIKSIFREEAKEGHAEICFKEELLFHAYATPLEHPVVKRFEQVCKKMGLAFEMSDTFGGSDQHHLSAHGIQGIVLASAMYQVHSCEEYTTIEDMEKVTEMTKLLMTSIF